MQSGGSDRKVQEVLPKSGLVVSEKGQLTEVGGPRLLVTQAAQLG